MRQIGWLRRGIIGTSAPRQHWSTTLFGVSVLGTLIATFLLVFDGWIDALAVYVVCGLILATLLSQIAGQQAKWYAEGSIKNGVHSLDDPESGLVFKQSSPVWFDRFYDAPQSNKMVSTTVLSKVISTD